jgi:hypothetical protein
VTDPRGGFEVNDTDLQQLLASMKEAGRIKRGEQEPARKFEIKAEGVKAIRTKLRDDSEKRINRPFRDNRG